MTATGPGHAFYRFREDDTMIPKAMGGIGMLVEIAGGGAIGLAWAVRLAAAGVGTRLWTRTREQAALIREGGATLAVGDGMVRAAPDARPAEPEAAAEAAAADAGRERWIIAAMKSHQLTGESAVRFLRTLAGVERAPVICLANGIGHMEYLASRMPEMPLLHAVTTEGALREGPAAVRLTGEGRTVIGMHPAIGRKRQILLVDTLSAAGIAAVLSNNIMDHVYGKLLVNAVVNPLTALFRVKNGELPGDPVRRRLMRALFHETLAVLKAAGMRTDGGEWDRLLDVIRRTADNRSSMLVDVEAGRPTEIDAINGGVARLARKAGIAAPLNEAVAALVGAIGPNEPGGGLEPWEHYGKS
ncbi:MAG: 2-dehydropantoate 2-reductase [Paenibacillaceae bacterium]|jgi:2-dehydropantoate 2-reductase|nr:MAG: 2-dehydropantoate 2-reductase [Paenibacillaceae bacterium]